MSKKATLVTVSSGYNSNTTINADLNAINDKLDNTLSLDGSTPNSMGADLDMDSNDILNVNSLTAETIILDGTDMAGLTSSAAEAAASAAAALVSETNAAASAVAAAASEASVLAVEDSLPEWLGAWVTATAYEVGDLVREDGSTYICVIAHTSGTFSTDLSAVKWELFAQKGAAGAGTGDMLAANNLSDVADAPTALSSIGGQPANAFLTTLASQGEVQLADMALSSVGSSQLLTNAVANAKIAPSAVTIDKISSAVYVTEAEGISANDNDTTLPTSAAVKDYVDDAIAATPSGGYEAPVITTITSDASEIVVTGLSGYRHVRAWLLAEVLEAGTTLTLQARATAGTWRTIGSWGGAGNTTGTHIALAHIHNFNNADGTGIRITSIEEGSTATDLDLSATEILISNSNNGSNRSYSSRAEVWDELKFVTTGTFEGDDADARSRVITEGY